MKKFLCGLGTVALVAIIAINVNVAHTGERLAGINWENVIALTNNEIKISFAYDASGNMTSRTLVNPSMAPPSPNGTDSIAVVFPEADDLEETGTGESSTKSAVSGAGKTKSAVAEIQKSNEMKINVYPNPTKGMLRVDITDVEISKDARIYLYNIQGAMIRQLTGISTTNELDISEQPAGVYLMRVILPDRNNVSTYKIIKE